MPIDKISIALPRDMVETIKDAVESGDYATTSEVVRDALRDWQYKRVVGVYGLAELRRMVQEGIDSGSSVSIDKVRDRLKAKFFKAIDGTGSEKRQTRSARGKRSE
ncbi:MAG TPA: type II toxin-antitoxin system ParD family antitoxin [Rhizomicrobium sp.]|jgi:antitoxin ParD1/3/4